MSFLLDRIYRIGWIFCFPGFLKKPGNSNLPSAEGHFVACNGWLARQNLQQCKHYESPIYSGGAGWWFLSFFPPGRRPYGPEAGKAEKKSVKSCVSCQIQGLCGEYAMLSAEHEVRTAPPLELQQENQNNCLILLDILLN